MLCGYLSLLTTGLTSESKAFEKCGGYTGVLDLTWLKTLSQPFVSLVLTRLLISTGLQL